MEDDIKNFIDNNRNTEEFYLVLRYKQGHCPGQFYRKLFDLFYDADSDNHAKLTKAFPLISNCLDMYRKESIHNIVEYLRNSTKERR